MGQLPVLGADGIPTGQTALFPGIALAYDLDWIYGGGIKAEQPIYMGGKIQAGYRMTKIGNEMAKQNKRLTESEVVLETSRAYAGVVRTKELMLCRQVLPRPADRTDAHSGKRPQTWHEITK